MVSIFPFKALRPEAQHAKNVALSASQIFNIPLKDILNATGLSRFK